MLCIYGAPGSWGEGMGQSSRHHGGQSVGGASEEGTLGWTLRWGKVTETGHLLLRPPPGLVP